MRRLDHRKLGPIILICDSIMHLRMRRGPYVGIELSVISSLSPLTLLFIRPILRVLSALPVLLLSLSTLLSSCERKTNIDFIDVPSGLNPIVSYIPMYPFFEGINQPGDVLAGYDQLLYVVETGNQQILSYDEAGNRLGQFGIKGINQIAQDRSLDLLVTGIFDTIIGSQNFSLACIYRIELKNTFYGLSGAKIANKIVHPFYYKQNFAASDALVRFTGIATFGDNRFAVARTGPDNFNLKFGGPDDAILLFDGQNSILTSPVLELNNNGQTSNDYFKKPVALITYANPPQSPSVSGVNDFIVTTRDASAPFKIIPIKYRETEDGASYGLNIFNQSDIFSRLQDIQDITMTGDGSNYVFVADAQSDSIFQFSTNGIEGVLPPAYFVDRSPIKVSFGGSGTGSMKFNHPAGLAYKNKILYVADRDNGRISRFKLTTDLR